MDLVVEARNQLGESPVWMLDDLSMYWLDLGCPSLHRWNLSEQSHTVTQLGGEPPLGAIIPSSTNQALVVARSTGLYELNKGTGDQHFLVNPIDALPHLHFNDAKTDRTGRLWLGTAESSETEPRALLYRCDQGSFHVADAGFEVCNGPAFSVDGTILYFSDSRRRRILAYNVDVGGVLHDRRVLVRFDEDDGYPDGLAVNVDGDLWVAHWGGGRISRFSSQGTHLESLAVPAPNVTSVAFGGVELDQLFITSARDGLDTGELEQWPLAGSLFVTHPPARGVAEVPWQGMAHD